jgi:hypothetical protein
MHDNCSYNEHLLLDVDICLRLSNNVCYITQDYKTEKYKRYRRIYLSIFETRPWSCDAQLPKSRTWRLSNEFSEELAAAETDL